MKAVDVVENVRFRTQLAVKDHSRLELSQWISINDVFGQLQPIRVRNQPKGFDLFNGIFGSVGNLDHLAGGPIREQLFVSDIQSALSSLGSLPDAAHGVATEIEEVVVPADLANAQLFTPNLR